MARPSIPSIAPGIVGWDTVINDAFAVVTQAPFPIHVEPDLATLQANFDPAQYEDCVVLLQTVPRQFAVSDGTVWATI